jgi:hypothetical protein
MWLLHKQPPIKPVEHVQPVEACHAGEDEPSSPLMVVWKEVEVPLPSDEQHRWDQLVGYNILDTVRYIGFADACRHQRWLQLS